MANAVYYRIQHLNAHAKQIGLVNDVKHQLIHVYENHVVQMLNVEF